EAEDGFGVFGGEGIDGGKESEQNILAGEFPAGVLAEQDRLALQVVWKPGLVHVDADAGDGLAIEQLYQDAGGLAVAEHEVVGPAQVALYAGGLGDSFDGGDTEGEGEYGRGRQDERAVDAGAGCGVPGVAVTSEAGELTIGKHDTSGFRCRGDPLGGIEGIEVKNLALGERETQAGEVDHASAPSAGKQPARRLPACPTIERAI